MEPEQQMATGTWSTRTDVPPPAEPISSYPVVTGYRAFLSAGASKATPARWSTSAEYGDGRAIW